MKERRFKIGDKVTYKCKDDCRSQYNDADHEYYWGGCDQYGYVGTVQRCDNYIEDKNCYRLEVTCREDGSYAMLECEFEEYDKKPELLHNFIINEEVYYENKPVTILGFHHDQTCCLINNQIDGHSGDNKNYSHNQHGLYIYIPFCDKLDKKFVSIGSLSKTLVKEEYKSLVGRYVKFNIPLYDIKAGEYLIITEDVKDDDCLNVKGYGAFDRNRLVNGDCELMPEGWKPSMDMKAIQEECKKRFPIGCRYIAVGCYHDSTLINDDFTYKIVEENIWAHQDYGCLYKNGEFAKLSPFEAKLDRVITSSDPKWAAVFSTSGHTDVTSDMYIYPPSYIMTHGIKMHTPSEITHQEAIITRKVKKSNKLIIK